MLEFTFTFKGFDSSEAIKQYAEKKFKRFEKYFEGPVNVQVVFKREKFREIVEVLITGDGEQIIAKEETLDIYEAIDLAYETLEKQIKKLKEKKKNFRKGRGVEISISQPEPKYEIQNVEVTPMSTEEAIEWFTKNQKKPFMLFYNIDYDKICLIYSKGEKPIIVIPEMS
ncbi:ribosome hibernation-promoting factor, HPF/YfiA family [Thermodesulfobacterium hydrogeniphilum]|uniref:ribosome hibernation-promoting factor, HPF/YfiA family n=1 Tax=Thermodesulfobacterium hydrogeniphilum TaxID=161156 RepID=UPI00068F51D9|nr:ribosome-associated translation inhibitor RaiA [Thermodesulfobacterium hydrogeniphilum]